MGRKVNSCIYDPAYHVVVYDTEDDENFEKEEHILFEDFTTSKDKAVGSAKAVMDVLDEAVYACVFKFEPEDLLSLVDKDAEIEPQVVAEFFVEEEDETSLKS